eukprot:Skav204693  [mRNA]  locus=scaffold7486:26142:27026:+ [translate_table: standard]
MEASIVIRTYNEARWLGKVLEACASQELAEGEFEVVIVDSGSTDATLEIARQGGARVTHINKSDFTFGRSLNVGCQFARGKFLVFISGHCIPIRADWLSNLIAPLQEKEVALVYGRQQGLDGVTKFSEEQLFRKYFPNKSEIPQEGFFCNNANSAVPKWVWEKYKFDENVTGLEDMVLGKALVKDGYKLGYEANASVIHIHEESWSKIRTRYEREAVALQEIMPEVHIRFSDFLRYTLAGVLLDCGEALNQRVFWKEIGNIICFRAMQYWGAYKGNNDLRKISQDRKDRYFYPR